MHDPFNCQDCKYWFEAGFETVPRVGATRQERPGGSQTEGSHVASTAQSKDSRSERRQAGDHELVQAFNAIKFPLNGFLQPMLNESSLYQDEIQSEVEGSGYTQASVHFAKFIQDSRSEEDLKIFDSDIWLTVDRRMREYERDNPEPFDPMQWREYIDRGALHQLPETVVLEESKILAKMIEDVIDPQERPDSLTLPAVTESLSMGICTKAEVYFLLYLNNELKSRLGDKRNGAEMNIIVGEDGLPIMFEKVGLGVDHSCLTLREIVLNGVRIPPGSLVGVSRPDDVAKVPLEDGSGNIISARDCNGFQFLRLSTLAVSPANRERAFGLHYDWHRKKGAPGYNTTSLSDFQQKATKEVMRVS